MLGPFPLERLTLRLIAELIFLFPRLPILARPRLIGHQREFANSTRCYSIPEEVSSSPLPYPIRFTSHFGRALSRTSSAAWERFTPRW